jgi:hypothetical protein
VLKVTIDHTADEPEKMIKTFVTKYSAAVDGMRLACPSVCIQDTPRRCCLIHLLGAPILGACRGLFAKKWSYNGPC